MAPVIRQAVDSDCTSISACAEAAYHMYIERIGKPPAPMVADFKSLIIENKIHVLERPALTQVSLTQDLLTQDALARERRLLGFVVCYFRGTKERGAQFGDNETANAYFLENIAVCPQEQGAGYGNRLVDHVIAMASDSGCNTIELYTNELMTENIAWYKKLGFTEFDRVYEDGFSRVYMSLNLRENTNER